MKKITFLFLLTTITFYGQWTNTPQNSTKIATGSAQQMFSGQLRNQHSVIVDEAQNVMTAFITISFNSQIFLQKTDIAGNRLFGNAGISVYNGAYQYGNNTQYTLADDIQVVADGAGGVIIAFVGRDLLHNPITSYKEVMAIRIDGNGNQVWSGRIAVSAPSLSLANFRIISDENGGAHVGWMSRYNNGTANTHGFKLFYQHINPDGTVTFPGGKLMKDLAATWPSGSDIAFYPSIVKMPSGNVMCSWKDYNAATSNWGLFCNMITPNGTFVWANDALVDTGVVSGAYISNSFPILLGATSNGVHVSYGSSNTIKTAFVKNDASIAYTSLDINDVSANISTDWKFDMTTTPTGDAMFVVVRSNGKPYLQKVSQDGIRMFGLFGKELGSIGSGYVSSYVNKIVRTSDNNYLVTFAGLFTGNAGYKMMGSLHDIDGTLLFPFGGTVLCHDEMEYTNLIPTNYGGAVLIGRQDFTDGNTDDIVGLHVLPSNNPIELALRIGTTQMTMATQDNLNFTFSNYSHTQSNALSFAKYGISNLYFPTMPSGYATYNASSSATLATGVYNLKYNAMTNFYEFESVLGVDNQVFKTVKLYPNPAVNQVSFSEPIQDISIFDMLGKQVLQINGQTEVINIEKFSNGIYLLKAQDAEGKAFSAKFVKK